MKLLKLLNYQLAIKFLCRFVIIYKIYNGKNYWKKIWLQHADKLI